MISFTQRRNAEIKLTMFWLCTMDQRLYFDYVQWIIDYVHSRRSVMYMFTEDFQYHGSVSIRLC